MTRDSLILKLILDKLRHWEDRKICYRLDDSFALAPDDSEELDIVEAYYIPPTFDEYGCEECNSNIYVENTKNTVGGKRCSSECENVIIL